MNASAVVSILIGEAKPKKEAIVDPYIGDVDAFAKDSLPVYLQGSSGSWGGRPSCDAIVFPSGRVVLKNENQNLPFQFNGFEVMDGNFKGEWYKPKHLERLHLALRGCRITFSLLDNHMRYQCKYTGCVTNKPG